MREILSFGLSVIVTFASIIKVLHLFKLRGTAVFFGLIPVLFVYLGFVSIVLSSLKLFESTYFLLMQFLILILVFWAERSTKSPLRNNIKILGGHQQGVERRTEAHFGIWGGMLVGAIIIVVTFSFYFRLRSTVEHFDDKMYRASAPLYWVQNKSIFRFPSVNERKNVFLMGSGLMFAWPVLFTSNGQLAYVFFWFSYPIAAISICIFLFKKHPHIALLGSFLFITMPLVFKYYTLTLVQENWLVPVLISFLYFLLRDATETQKNSVMPFFVGLSFGALLFIKQTSLFLSPLLLIYLKSDLNKRKKPFHLLFGLLAAITVSGYMLLSYQNSQIYGSILGSNSFRNQHIAVFTPKQIYVHIVRTVLLFIETPIPYEPYRKSFENILDSLNRFVKGSYLLQDELDNFSKGQYFYHNAMPNTKFGIAGIAWFSILLFSFLYSLDHFIKKQKTSIYQSLLVLVGCSLFLISIVVRWQEQAEIPLRHFVSLAGVTMCLIPFSSTPVIFKNRLLKLAVLCVVVFVFINTSVMLSIYAVGELDTNDNWQNKLVLTMASPFENFVYSLRKPARILLLEDEYAQDYSLFWYKGMNKNTVIPIDRLTQETFSIFQESADYLIVYNNKSDPVINNLKSSRKITRVERLYPSDGSVVDIYCVVKSFNVCVLK